MRKAGRSLAWLGAIIAVLAAVVAGNVLWNNWDPGFKLALDLQGGTQIILAPAVADADPTPEQLNQAVSIIRQRVDATGVAEAEISTLGNNIVVALPGEPDQATLDRIQASAKLEFRAVLLSAAASTSSADDGTADDEGTDEGTDTGETPAPDATETPGAESPDPAATPTVEPTDGSDLNWITPDLQAEFDSFDCGTLDTAATNVADPDVPLVTCDDRGFKFLLGPVEVDGSNITDATARQRQGTNGVRLPDWGIYPVFDEQGTEAFADVTTRLVQLTGDRNRFAAVLDGRVLIAPSTNGAITNGQPEISGNFVQREAQTIASQLKFGALPLSFEVQSRATIAATLGESQLQAGLLAGLIGLVLVVIYSLFQYRALASVTIASLLVAGGLTYLTITILAQHYNYRLSLAGVAGLIIAIGMTVDSFIVYFERVRDELRDGRSVVGAVEAGWKRALRTIIAAKGVNLLSAVVLYIFAVGNVRGFAFTLGITVIIDVLVVVLFTHPMLQLLASTRFFSSGHPLSCLDPEALGAVYRGRAEFRISKEARRAGASREAARRQTIAERKAAQLEETK